MTTWILVANASIAHLYQYDRGQELQRLETLAHPESRMKTTNLNTDLDGRVRQATGQHDPQGTGHIGAGGGNYGASQTAHDKEVEDFARQLARQLETGRVHNQYDHLVLVASPPMLGTLNSVLNRHVGDKITASINKDYTHLPQPDLMAHLEEVLY